MARTQYGSIITDMQGSIGGLTYQHNASGKITRQRPSTVRQSTSKQCDRQSVFSDLVTAWSALTPAQKVTWATLADTYTKYNKWNEEKTLNGFNWFLSCNGYLSLVSEALLTSAPVWESPLSVPSYSLILSAPSISVSFGGGFDYPNHYGIVYMSSYLRTSGLYDRKQLRLVHIEPPGYSYGWSLLSSWESTHGLDWPPTSTSESVYITCAIQMVHGSKGLASIFNLVNSNYTVT